MTTITNEKEYRYWQERFPAEECFGFDIMPYITLVHFDSQETLLEEGETPSVLYFLLEGRVKIYVTHSSGKVTLVNFAEAPCFLGEMELLEAREKAIGVQAATPCTCYAIHYNKGCKDALWNDVRFLRRLCQFLAVRSVENTNRYSWNHSGKLENRLAGFIMRTAYHGIYRERHTEAAEFLGVTYRHLLYVLADFVEQGILEKRPSGYYIIKPDVLERMSGKTE